MKKKLWKKAQLTLLSVFPRSIEGPQSSPAPSLSSLCSSLPIWVCQKKKSYGLYWSAGPVPYCLNQGSVYWPFGGTRRTNILQHVLTNDHFKWRSLGYSTWTPTVTKVTSIWSFYSHRLKWGPHHVERCVHNQIAGISICILNSGDSSTLEHLDWSSKVLQRQLSWDVWLIFKTFRN